MPIDIDNDLDQSLENSISVNNENEKVIERPHNNGYTFFINQSQTAETQENVYSQKSIYDINKYSSEPVIGEKPDHISSIRNLSTKELRKNVMRSDEEDVKEYIKRIAEEDKSDLRSDTIFMEALKYGTQSGLYYRTYQINEYLNAYSNMFDATFVFQPLLLAEGRVTPPVILEGEDSFFIQNERKYSQVNKTFKIHKQAKVVTAPMSWRTYVHYEAQKPVLPDKMSLPLNKKEDAIWADGSSRGWEMGIKQANNIFTQQIKDLNVDFVGMVRYHLLEKAGVINTPIFSSINIGINTNDDQTQNNAMSGDARNDTINIGETIFEISKLPDFNNNSQTWKALPKIENYINVDNI